MSQQLDNELLVAKTKLYRLLLTKVPNQVTPTESVLITALAEDQQVQSLHKAASVLSDPPVPKRQRIVRVEGNARGGYEVWEENGMKGGHAGMAVVATLEDGITTAIRRLGHPLSMKKGEGWAELIYAS